MQTIVDYVRTIDAELDRFHQWREERRQFYADGLSYKEINDLKITKQAMCQYFVNPQTNKPIPPTKKRISILWCRHQQIAAHFWERWWMVFDTPPHGNSEVPLYFLRNLWAEFELGKKPNYFNMRSFQGAGHGIPNID